MAILISACACDQPKPPPPDAGHQTVCFPRVTGPTDVDIDLVTGTVSGTLTVNGQPMPDSPAATGSDPNQRGYLVLTDSHGARYELPLGRSGPAHFSGLVFGGTYVVELRTERDAQLTGLPKGVVAHLQDALVITGDTQLDLDVPLLTTTGTLTFNGNTWPDATASRGKVTFNDTLTGSRYQFDVGATGAATCNGSVFAGTYDVTFVGGADFTPFPAYAPITLERGRTVTAGGTTDYDVQTLAVGGTLTLSGAQLPDSPMLPSGGARGALVFTDLTTNENFIFTVGATGPATWSGVLPKSSFKVTFLSANDPNVSGIPPYQSELLAPALTVSTPGALDFDLGLADVSGTLTLAGAALPDSPMLPDGGDRGAIVFTQRASGKQTGFGVGKSGAAHYSGQLFAGDYDIAFSTAGANVSGLPNGYPTSLELGAHLSGPRPHDYDLNLVNLSVTVALDGGELGDGGVQVIDPITAFQANLAFTPPGTFQTQLFEGHYDLLFATTDRGEVILEQQLDVHQGLSPLTYPVAFNPVSGTLTLNGEPIAEGPRGSLVFSERLTHWPTSVALDPSGPARFHGTVLGALYDVRLLSDVNGPEVGMPSSVLTQIASGCTK
jgi:hypothetical protein